MNRQNRWGIYGCYLFGAAGIGFTLPFLALYLGQEGLSDQAIGWISTCAALSGLAQFPLGLWSDRLGTRKPFLVVAAALLAISAVLLERVHNVIGIAILVVLFAENGICRAVIESLTGAEVTARSSRDEIGTALGRLRMWKPVGIIAVALIGGGIAVHWGVGRMLTPVAVLQGLGFAAACLIRESRSGMADTPSPTTEAHSTIRTLSTDGPLCWFILAMVLFHAANAPGGLYLGLHLKRGLQATDAWIAWAFVVSMIGWMLIVWPGGRLADRVGRRPMLIAAWGLMSVRLLFVAVATTPTQIIVNQILDGAANGLFAVLAATWVTDRLADPGRTGEAQVIVGTSLVLGSAIGPAVSALLIEQLGYRGMFAALAGLGAVATAVVVLFVPETLPQPREIPLAVQQEMCEQNA